MGEMSAYQVVKRPVITEKSNIATGYNQYTFEVDRRANKTQIRDAVEPLR
jgi:large subunit ribosomal protein L23